MRHAGIPGMRPETDTRQEGLIVALFNRKKNEDEGDDQEVVFSPQPETARKWFDHAKTMSDSSNYESALVYYANGIRLDPAALSAHEAMIDVSIKHLQSGGKKASSKDLKGVDGPHPVDKLAAAELAWLSRYDSPSLAVKALSAAVDADQLELANMLTIRVLTIVSRAKKVSRSQVLQVKDLASAAGAWNEAITAGQLALQMDPTDSELDTELKDLAAQRAMSQGGYEDAGGKEGGFREMVKDMDKQRELEQEESLAGVGGSEDEVLDRAREQYLTSPGSPDVLNRYAQLLRKEGSTESIKKAMKVYMEGFEATDEYRFRMHAGDLEISLIRRSIDEASDPTHRQELETQLIEKEVEEYSQRVERYPTDRTIKFKLGDISYRADDIGTAMECFQKSKDEPKLRTRSGHYLARCFAREGWHSEAVDEYRDTISNMDATERDLELDIRYDLMESLIELAREERSDILAREALEICSGIARKDITYRDIRARRKELDTLCRELG